ncbi:MAG: ABC transporter substrate-binding protein [Alphaproteobacteria bacterium]|nr:ABC transporter substrate-binding protein [Alphaproteobacteria bacterium]
MLRTLLLAASALTLLAVPAAAQNKVKIGFIATMSGPAGAIGKDMEDGFRLGIEHAGGKLGGLEPEVIIGDDQLKPEVGVQLVDKMLNRDKVDMVAGIVFSNVMMAAYKPIVDSKTFLVSTNAGPSPIAGAQCSPYYFSTSWQNDQAHEAMGKYMQDKGYKKAYLMAPNYQAGKDALEGVKRYFKGQVVGEVYTTVNQPDYSAEIAQAAASGADALYVFYPGGMGINFVKQYAQAGLKSKLPLHSAFTVDTTTLPAQGDAALGLLGTAFWTDGLDNPVNKKFVDDFVKKHNRVPSTYAAQSYDGALLINAALTQTKGNLADKDALRAAFKKADFKSVRGNFRFNTNQHPIQNFYLFEVVKRPDGKLGTGFKATVFTDHADAYAKDCPMK